MLPVAVSSRLILRFYFLCPVGIRTSLLSTIFLHACVTVWAPCGSGYLSASSVHVIRYLCNHDLWLFAAVYFVFEFFFTFCNSRMFQAHAVSLHALVLVTFLCAKVVSSLIPILGLSHLPWCMFPSQLTSSSGMAREPHGQIGKHQSQGSTRLCWKAESLLGSRSSISDWELLVGRRMVWWTGALFIFSNKSKCF